MNARPSFSLRLLALLVAPLLFASLVLALGSSPSMATQTGAGSLLAVRYIDSVIERVDPESASALLGPNAVLHTPEGVFQGPEGANQFSATLNASFTNLDFQIKSIDAAGDTIVMPFTLTGINTASYLGLPANCAGVAVPGVVVLNLEDGAIGEQWIAYDQDVLRSQIDGFNQIDAALRPTCADTLQPVVQAVPTPDTTLPPTCLKANLCELPY